MQAHMSGQVTGQVPNQADLAQQNGNALPVQQQPNGIRSWHTEGDHTVLRACINKKIHNFLSQRLKEQHPDWQMRLPDMVRRLEGLLFRQASTKEEYMNVANLEQRLQSIIKQVQNRNHSLSQQSAPVGTMIPTPGLQHSGSASTMIPTPGTDTSMVSGPGPSNMIHSATGMGNISMCNTENPNLVQGTLSEAIQPQHGVGNMSSSMMKGMGMPRVGSQMIPTPGLNNSQTMSTNSNGLVPSNVDSLVVSQNQQLHPQQQFQHQQQQQHLYSGNQNNRIYPSMNGQMNGMMAMGMQHKNPYLLNGGMNNGMQFMPGNQHVMNGSSALNTIGSYMNHSRYGVHSQHMNQRQRQVMQLTNQMGSMSSDGYAMNAADLAGSAAGNLYGSATTSGHAAGGNLASNSVPAQSKMIPVPGLPNQQQPVQQHKSQALEYTQQNNYQLPRNQSGKIYSSQVQQPLQQSTQHQMHQTQQYHQQHYTQQQNQQPQIKTEDTQQFHMAQTLSPQSHSSVGLHPQSETINNVDGSHPSSEQLQQQVTTMQMQQSMSAGMMQIDQVLPESQHLNHQTPQKAHHLQAFSPQEQQQSLSQNDSSSLHNEMMPESASHPLHNPEERLHGREQVRQSADGQHGQQEVEQSMSSQDISQNNQAQPRAYLANEAMQPNSIKNESLSGGTGPSGQPAAVSEARQAQYHKQQRWLLFLRHASKCIAPEGQCNMPHCPTAKQLWIHITKCQETQCMYPKCQASKTLLRHHQQCRDANCPVCSRVRQIIMQQRQGMAQRSNTGDTSSTNGLRRSVNPTVRSDSNGTANMKFGSASPDAISIQQPPTKKPKVEPSSPSPVPVTETQVSTLGNAGKIATNQLQTQVTQQSGLCQGPVKSDTLKPVKLENLSVKAENVASTSQYMLQRSQEIKKETVVDAATQSQKVKDDPCVVHTTNVFSQTKQDFVSSKKELGQVKMESGQVKQEPSTAEPSADNSALSKQGKPKIKGVSLTELFTPEQIKEHITGLRQWVGQSKAKAERHQAMENQMSENSCQLCAVEKLTFEPPPIYCTLCGGRIKRNAMYFTLGSGDTRHYFCIPCHNDVRGEAIEVDGLSLPKSRLEKRKNDEETEEAWVQCDKCEAWQHQICALFNGRRNEGGQAEYTCPNCYVAEIERGERKPLPQSAVLGAKDLPRTQLSDHIEQRLFKKLKEERLERAKSQGKTYEEVQGAESLVVRVVSNVDKKLEVKQRFLDVFKEEDYPTEYPYKSKVLLLFQKIEGVEVCLFGMYVQEFGTESSQPNQRRVYLSYLDSVKYFRPEVKAVTGEALRTFVYHEILIGYLEYCKRRGLTSCYIWACPPLKGEDYILYCHPEIQKTPKSDKLREWYLSMLKKATRENIVVELTNLHDHFFVPMDESKAKVTAVRLPYFDGDYWPGAAEDFIMQLQQEEEDGRKQQKKGKTKKTATKRATKAAAQAELTSNASKDALLMQRLRDSIAPMKEDFIMVHMQYACAHCCSFILYGKRWSCQQCKSKSFNLCDKCYEAQQRLDEREWHPVNGREKHSFYPIEVPDVPTDTTDKDELVESEFFDTRQAFLSLCQGNHYQYDTLRRAKHSSMMVLYHLHNPTAPAFVTTCNICHHDIETGQGWRCETCPDFDICNACYRKNGSSAHPHKLTQHTSLADRDAQSKEARQQRVLQLRIMLELLVHASKCGNANCLYPNCRRVKGLFRHGMQCKIRASGGCALCKKMWYILQLHARACKESECKVPRCKDLKEHLRRLQQQMESRRRAAVNEMMRQRKAEVAGHS